MALKEASEQSAEPWSRCEFGKTLYADGECQRPGEVKLDGRLLYVLHATLLRFQVRESTLLGTVLEKNKWLENPNNRAEQLVCQRVLDERDESVEDLRFIQSLIEAHKETDQQR